MQYDPGGANDNQGCTGDSGGPVMRNGTIHAVHVASDVPGCSSATEKGIGTLLTNGNKAWVDDKKGNDDGDVCCQPLGEKCNATSDCCKQTGEVVACEGTAPNRSCEIQ